MGYDKQAIFTSQIHIKNKRLNIQFPTVDIAPLNENCFLCSQNNANLNENKYLFNLISVNSESNIISRNIEIPKYWKNITYSANSLKDNYNDKLILTNYFNNSIYEIDQKNYKLQRKYIFDFKSNNINIENIYQNISDKLYAKISPSLNYSLKSANKLIQHKT